ncbi:MAG: hypothetical protein ACFFD2_00195 [Promethearchaeota archaeon]
MNIIEWNIIGMSVEDNSIIGLGLYIYGLTNLPEFFGGLKSLQNYACEK